VSSLEEKKGKQPRRAKGVKPWLRSELKYEGVTHREAQAIEALREAEEKLHFIFESIGDGITILDMQGNVVDINEQAIRIGGHSSKEQVIGRNGLEFIKKEDRDSAANSVMKALSEGRASGMIEYRLVTADGDEKDVQVSVAPLKDKTGNPVGIITVTRDISERKRAEEVVKGTADKLNTILQSVGDAITVVDLRGTIVEANEAAARLSGYSSKDELIGKNGLELVSPRDRKLAAEVVSQALKAGRTTGVVEYTLATADGGEKDVEVSVASLCDSSGKPIGIITAARDISERRGMEQAVRASEEKLRAMFESIEDAVIVSDMQGTIVEVNDAALSISGWTREQFIGRNAIDIIAEKDRAAAIDSIMKQAQGEITMGAAECTLILSEGRELDAEFTASLLRDAAGNPIGTVTVARDITERKKAEEALRDSGEKLRAIFDSAIDGILLIDLMGNFLEANNATLKMTGYSREDLIGKSALDFIVEEDRQKVINDMANTIASKQMVSAPPLLRLLRKDGSIFLAELGSGMILDKQGNVTGLVGVMRDVTERQRLEDEVRASEEKLRGIFEAISDSIILSTPDGRVIDLNDAAVRLHGYTSKEELIGKNAVDLVAESDRQKVAEQGIKALKKAGTFDRLEYKVLRADGTEFDAEFSGVPLCDSAGKVVRWVTMSRDITQRKQMQEELRKTAEKLRIVVESIGDMLIITDRDLKYVDVNEAAMRMLGCTDRGELLEKEIAEAISGKDRDRVIKELRRALKKKSGIELIEYALVSADGKEHEVEAAAEILRDCAGVVAGLVVSGRDVTERRRMQEEVRASEEKLRTTFDAIGDGITVTDVNGTIISVNDAVVHMGGFATKEELIGRNGFELMSEPDRKRIIKETMKAFSEGRNTKRMEYTFVPAKGRPFSADLQLTMLRDSDGNPSGFIGMTRDISDRLEMEKAMKESEARFRELFENMSSGVAVYEAVNGGEEFVFKDFNQAAERIGNTTKDKVIGKRILEAYPKLKEFGLFGVLQRVWKTGNPERLPDSYYEDEYRKGWRDNYIYKLPTGEVVAVYDDVTDRIKAMEEVRASGEKLRAMFESTSDGIVVTDPRFNILEANEAAARIFGHKSKESLIGTSALGLISAEKAVDADGKQILIEFSLSQIRDTAGNLTGNIGVVRDVTVRRRMEASLKKTVANLERSNRDMQQFVYVASHDLQEPLRMISSFTQLLNRRYKGKLDAEADDFITYAVNGANVLQERIQALAIFSRVSTQGKPLALTDLELVLERALSSLNSVIESSKAVVTHDPLPSIVADSAQMAQVFQYLIDNAIKFRGEATPQIRVSAKEQGDEWVFSVSDNGMGIMPEFKERIFVLFQRLHGVEFGGTGIGLPVSKKIVERHGGRIWVESEPGKGSTFYFAIPKEIPEEESIGGPAGA
jgi:PAS domain S-box-containing protein